MKKELVISYSDSDKEWGKNIISFKNVSKIYSSSNTNVIAIENINLNIIKNEFLCIVGPSGCGKTTLLNLVGDIIKPSSGKISVEGKSPEQARKDRYFGYVFQDSGLFPWRTVTQNISLPIEIFGEKADPYKINKLIELVGLSSFENFFPRELSKGMKSKVALARALIYNPTVILMDEPFANIDELTRENLNYELLKIWDSFKKTVLFVTHNISEAVFLADRIIIMSRRPGCIKRIININLKRPRSSDLRKTNKYFEFVEKVRSILKEEL